MAAIDRNRVRRSFDQHADEYDIYACVQKRVVNRFAGLLRESSTQYQRVLDIGAGTGMLLQSLKVLYPTAEVVGLDLAFGMSLAARSNLKKIQSPVCLLTADAEQLPFSTCTFDLAVSTSTFQWFETLERVFSEANRVLRPGGVFNFALFGERTLHELRDSYQQAWVAAGLGSERRTQHFLSAQEVRLALEKSGFHGCHVFSELETEIHDDVPALLRSIRRIGAGNTSPVTSRGLSERRVMLKMMDVYCRDYAINGQVPATYEVIYGLGSKK